MEKAVSAKEEKKARPSRTVTSERRSMFPNGAGTAASRIFARASAATISRVRPAGSDSSAAPPRSRLSPKVRTFSPSCRWRSSRKGSSIVNEPPPAPPAGSSSRSGGPVRAGSFRGPLEPRLAFLHEGGESLAEVGAAHEFGLDPGLAVERGLQVQMKLLVQGLLGSGETGGGAPAQSVHQGRGLPGQVFRGDYTVVEADAQGLGGVDEVSRHQQLGGPSPPHHPGEQVSGPHVRARQADPPEQEPDSGGRGGRAPGRGQRDGRAGSG